MYMQVPSGAGKEDEVGKMTDVSAIVPLLQAIFAILLDSGKTLQTVAAKCETVSTESARPSPVGGFDVPQLIEWKWKFNWTSRYQIFMWNILKHVKTSVHKCRR